MKPGKLYRLKPEKMNYKHEPFRVCSNSKNDKENKMYLNKEKDLPIKDDILMFLCFKPMESPNQPDYPVFLYKQKMIYPISFKIDKNTVLDLVEEVC